MHTISPSLANPLALLSLAAFTDKSINLLTRASENRTHINNGLAQLFCTCGGIHPGRVGPASLHFLVLQLKPSLLPTLPFSFNLGDAVTGTQGIGVCMLITPALVGLLCRRVGVQPTYPTAAQKQTLKVTKQHYQHFTEHTQ